MQRSINSFYRNKVLEQFSSIECKTVTLNQLAVFGRSCNTLERILTSANYIRQELPVRLAHRIRCFQQLPYVVGTSPNLQEVYQLYLEAFEAFREIAPVTTLEQNKDFCYFVQKMLDRHRIAVPFLALGIADSSRYLSLEAADKFMDETIRSRISRRILAEHHLALSNTFTGKITSEKSMIGVINSHCHAASMVKKCTLLASTLFEETYGAQPPMVVVDGYLDVTFKYIPEHIEFLLFELLKNSMRFTAETHLSKSSKKALPPIRVTISKSESQVLFRVSDQGGGIQKDILENIWSWTLASQRNLTRLENVTKLSGKLKNQKVNFNTPLGLGLPMARAYTEYWGGNMDLYSMQGLGTDVYFGLNIGNHLEQLN